MDRSYVIQNDIIDRYLRGQLSIDEAQAFEEHCLWCTESLDDLELAEKLRQGLKNVDASPPAARFTRRWPRFLQSPQYAAAATVLLAVSLTATGVLYDRVSDPVAAGFASTEIYSFEPVRSATGTAPYRVAVTGPDSQVVLIVYLDSAAARQYRVTVQRHDEAVPVWQSMVHGPAGDSLAVALPGRVLKSDTYVLRVIDADQQKSSETVAEIAFETFAADAMR